MPTPTKPSEDKTLYEIKRILEQKTPVFILRHEEKDRDVCILYLADALKVPIVKIALERVGPHNDNTDILRLVKSTLEAKGNKKALIWVKNINNGRCYNFERLVQDISKLVTDDYLVFSGIYDTTL